MLEGPESPFEEAPALPEFMVLGAATNLPAPRCKLLIEAAEEEVRTPPKPPILPKIFTTPLQGDQEDSRALPFLKKLFPKPWP